MLLLIFFLLLDKNETRQEGKQQSFPFLSHCHSLARSLPPPPLNGSLGCCKRRDRLSLSSKALPHLSTFFQLLYLPTNDSDDLQMDDFLLKKKKKRLCQFQLGQ